MSGWNYIGVIIENKAGFYFNEVVVPLNQKITTVCVMQDLLSR
jgi:hypothetical protein